MSTLCDYINLLMPNDYQKSVKIIYKNFKDKYLKRIERKWKAQKSVLDFELL